jgi:hypothetical protein
MCCKTPLSVTAAAIHTLDDRAGIKLQPNAAAFTGDTAHRGIRFG